MAQDFRELLVEASRHDVFGRYFKELQIGMKVVMSIQASETHSCDPAETLDDIYQYKKWEVSLRQSTGNIVVANVGAWTYLKNNVWAKTFEKPEFANSMDGEFIKTADVQQCFEDVIDYAMSKNQIDSADEIRVVEPDENLKKRKAGGCGGCGGGKKPAPKAE